MFKDFQSEIKLFLLVAFIAIVISVGGILLLKAVQPAPFTQIPQPVPSPQTQPVDTSNWKTYRSDEFGFEVRYPGICSKILENIDSLFSVSCIVNDVEFVERFVFSSWGHVGFSCDSIKECESSLNFSAIKYKDDKTAIIERTRNGNKEFALVFIAKDTSLGTGIGEVQVQQKSLSGTQQFDELANQILSTFRFVP